jgi:formylmethanofuran dehydrogenase subunit E
MAKEKESEGKSCDTCGEILNDQDVMRHSGSKYCPKCIAEHIRNEHYNKEVASVWTYRRGV